MSTFAIIPARCGSKAIPFKNLYLINGKPLISYCVSAIIKSSIDRFYVSTDCSKIIEYCIDNKINYIIRPEKFAQDNSPTIDCIRHAIEYLSLNPEDILLTIQATSPLILSKDINDIINKLNDNDYAITVCEDHKVLWEENTESLSPLHHNPLNRRRRQDYKKIFHETGSIYGTRVKHILRNNSIHGDKSVGYIEIPKSRSFEIDDYEDIYIIESILKNIK